MLRRDLAYLLTLPDPRYPTENDARIMLWQAFKLDSDESLINYLKSTKIMTFPEPPTDTKSSECPKLLQIRPIMWML